MADPVVPNFNITREQLAAFVKDPRTIRDLEAFLRMVREQLPLLVSVKVDETRLITSGDGLTGGGDLSADRTLNVGAGTGITVNADDVAIDTTAEAERIRDVIGAALVAGANITITVDDPGNTITIAGSAAYTDENARDALGAALVAGSGISITVNDPADTITIAAVGGAGASTPTVVQVAKAVTNGSSVTMGAAPTAGNLLIAMCTHWNNSPTIASGWTQLLSANGSAIDGVFIAYKYCGGSESTTQTPATFGASGNDLCVFEVSGADIGTVGRYLYALESTGTTFSLTVNPPTSNCLVIGVSALVGNNLTPTMTNATASGTTTGTTASGSPRSITSYSATPSSGSTTTITATYGSSVTGVSMLMLLGPA